MVKDSFYPHANASHFPEKAKNYMLILEEKSELTRNILQLNKLPTWNPLAKAIVFYQLNKTEDAEQTAIEFINELRHYKLFKSIIFIYSPEEKEVISYTWTPYSDTNCGGKCDSVYILDTCKDNVIHELATQKEMFPLDMKGCPLVTYAIVSEPYVLPPAMKLSNTSYNDAYVFQKGGEINLGIKRAAKDRNFAVVSSRRQAAYADQRLGKGKPLIYCFSESDNLYKYGVVLLARKWFPMLERFNTIIRSVSENGLIDKWNQELLIHTANAEGASEIEPLSIQHLLGAFMFIGFMYAASIVVFIAEICIGVFQKWKARKNWQWLYKHIRFRNAK
ncbi:uncharacterized protein LOC135080908 [Ostrinia nubilalis]|uniref:uncharacterized protein LOC135080908 n=1 Tax=Ostrinia nubilalis TaxID=29057 RepID=UPI00308252F5